ARVMLLSGTRIPTVFFFVLNNFGTCPLALKINVNGPGRAFFSSLKVAVSNGLVYWEMPVRSSHMNDKLAFSGLIPRNSHTRSIARWLLMSHPNPYTVSVG